MRATPSFLSTLHRAARLSCPACGRGRIFARPFLRAESCGHCHWRFERGEGHWVGGAEVHMFASYLLSVLVCIPALILFGRTPLMMGLVIGAHVAVSLLGFHYSRALFLGLDYWLDPSEARGDDGDEGRREPVRPGTPPAIARRRAPLRTRGSRRTREPVLR